MELKKRIKELEKENAELKRQLEIRQKWSNASEEKQGLEDLKNPEKMTQGLAWHMERIGDKYAKIIQEKMDNNANHYGNGLAEINEGIRILHHIAGMIAKTRVKVQS